VRQEKNPGSTVTYIIDRQHQTTRKLRRWTAFCPSSPDRPKQGEGYSFTFEQIGAKIDELSHWAGQI